MNVESSSLGYDTIMAYFFFAGGQGIWANKVKLFPSMLLLSYLIKLKSDAKTWVL